MLRWTAGNRLSPAGRPRLTGCLAAACRSQSRRLRLPADTGSSPVTAAEIARQCPLCRQPGSNRISSARHFSGWIPISVVKALLRPRQETNAAVTVMQQSAIFAASRTSRSAAPICVLRSSVDATATDLQDRPNLNYFRLARNRPESTGYAQNTECA